MLKCKLVALALLSLFTAGSPVARSGSVVGDALASASRGVLVPFGLETRCATSGIARSMRVYRGELAIWNGRRQTRLRVEDSRALLALIHEAGFEDFDERYGGIPRAAKQEAPLRVSCRVHLELQGFEKTSVQLYEGQQSERLTGLAEALLDHVGELADRGVSVQSLEEGLEHLAAGSLAAETLRVRYVRLPGNPGENGLIVQVEHGRLSHQAYAPGRTLDPRVPAPMGPACLQRIVTAVQEAAFWHLPTNIRWPASMDLEIGVLDRQNHVNAREDFRAQATPRALEQLAGLIDALESLSPVCDRAAGE